MKIIIFGVGWYYKSRKNYFDEETIVAFADNNAELQGTTIDGVEIIAPQLIVNYEYDYICLMIASDKRIEVLRQLVGCGIEETKIVDYKELFKKTRRKKIHLYINSDIYNSDVSFLLAKMENTGTLRAAINAIKVFISIGKKITVIAPCKGPAFDEIMDLDVNLIISCDISESNDFIMRVLESSKTVFLNSINYSYLVSELQALNKNIIWWIHTGESGYKTVDVDSSVVIEKKTKVYGVSKLVCDAFKRHCNNQDIGLLPYGIEDNAVIKREINNNNKKIFVIVGRLSATKGIDIAVAAFKKMDESCRKKSELWIVGGIENNRYYTELLEQIGDEAQIKLLGEKKHNEVYEILKQVDVLISSSREDMLPNSITEALMCGIPCILSDSVGTVDYLQDGISAFIYSKQDIDSLSKIMTSIIDGYFDLKGVGECGRKVYEKQFSEEVFKNRLLELI